MNNIPHYVFVVDDECRLSRPANEGDAGYDVIAVSEPEIVGVQYEGYNLYERVDYIEYDLGVKIDGFQPISSPHPDIFTLVFPRSSISKQNLVLANSVGVIDSGFRATLKARFKYIFQPQDLVLMDGKVRGLVNLDKIYHKGDKVCQLLFKEHLHPTIEFVSKLDDSERNEGGFGSTGL